MVQRVSRISAMSAVWRGWAQSVWSVGAWSELPANASLLRGRSVERGSPAGGADTACDAQYLNKEKSSVVWPLRNAKSFSGSLLNQTKVPQASSDTNLRKAGALRSEKAVTK